MPDVRLARPLLEDASMNDNNTTETMIDAKQAAPLRLPYYWFADHAMRSKYRIPHYLMGGWCAIACLNFRQWAAKQQRRRARSGDQMMRIQLSRRPNDRLQRHRLNLLCRKTVDVSDAEREELRAELLARLESVLFTLFPAGKKRRGKFLIGDVLGSPGDSLEVVLDGEKAGLWTDRATGDGGDIFDLIAGHFGSIRDQATSIVCWMPLLICSGVRAPRRCAKARSRTAPVDELGPATAKWDYLDATGNLIAVVYRYDPPGQKKQFRPGMPSGARWHRPIRARSTTSRAWSVPRRWCWSRARNARRP
jgi:hypothetical protein